MAARVGTRTYGTVSLGTIVYLIIGLIITIAQGYWKFTDWDGHTLSSLLTAVSATLLWPISIFYTFALYHR
jgi:hypothetical protein